MKVLAAYDMLFEKLIPLYGKAEAVSIAQIVLEDGFGIRNVNVKKELSEIEVQRIHTFAERLLKKEPVQYVVGMTYFYGYKFTVNPSVLIPRPETEELVHWILEDHSKGTNTSILDVGTGSGCIPITIKKKRPHWQVEAVDVSETALETAALNAKNLNATISFHQLDFLNETDWQHLPSYDIIVSNPPYIPHQERHLMPDHVLDFEPDTALFVADGNPLVFYRKLAIFAKQHLRKNGNLYVETNEFNAQEVKTCFEAHGLPYVEIRKDMQGKERMVRGGRKIGQ